MKSYDPKYWFEKLKSIDSQDAELVKEFLGLPENLNLEARSKANYVRVIYYLRRFLKKPLTEVKEEDIYRYLAERSEEVSPWTLQHEYMLLRRFFRLMSQGEKPKLNVILNSKLRPPKKPEYHVCTEDFLTQEEFWRLYGEMKHVRDKALLMLLKETGCRIGEALALDVKDVQTLENRTYVYFRKSKTNPRRVPIIESLADLREWLRRYHPDPRPENPLFVKLRKRPDKKEPERLTYMAFWKVLHQAMKRAGINKRIHPHLFRHMRATELFCKLSDEVARKILGWSRGSRMVEVYSHLTENDAEREYLKKLYGIETEPQEEEERGFKPCPKCGTLVRASAKFCDRCGQVLDMAKALEIQEMEEVLGELFGLLKDRKALERLKKFLRGET